MQRQYEATRRIQGQDGIHKAAERGSEELVALHINADVKSVDSLSNDVRLGESQYVWFFSNISKYFAIKLIIYFVFDFSSAFLMPFFLHHSATTPLITAVLNGHLNVARLLIKANAQVDLADV